MGSGVVWSGMELQMERADNRWHSSKQILTMFQAKESEHRGKKGWSIGSSPKIHLGWDGDYGSPHICLHKSLRTPDPVIRFPDKLESSKSVSTALWLGGECDVKPDCDMCNVQKTIFRASVLVFPFLLLSFLMLETCNWICSVAPLLFGDSQ